MRSAHAALTCANDKPAVPHDFCRPHKALKGATPAMAAGIAVRAYSLGELLAEAA
jgi:hypothetical protein